MARGRNKILEESNVEIAAQEEEEQIEAPAEAKVEAEEAPKAEEKDEAKETVTSEIPPRAIQLLRIFNAYDELYITPWGGVFTSPQAHVKDAVLYKNPFYKK